jgi:hypothetical protein
MWKFVFVLLVTALALLVALADAPVIQTRVGAVSQVQVTYAYAGVRG